MLPKDTLLQNRYRIINLLGQGGMGAVYLAIDERLGHEIALKQMFQAQREILAQAFEREARILARLNHRCLPKVSDHFAEGDSRFLIMQYISGTDLGDLLKKNQRPFPPEQVLIWADSLLDALEYLHNHEPPILHRDIKPQNLKINQQGDLFLLDFGLAKDTAANMTNSSTPPSVLGYSLNYSPLEQIDRQRTTVETDIYAVCATLYHLLTNRLPADALTRLSGKVESEIDPLIPADELNPEVSPELAAVLERGLVLRREERIKTRELRQLLKNLSPLTTNPFPVEAFKRKETIVSAPTIVQKFTDESVAASPLATFVEPVADVRRQTIKVETVPDAPPPKPVKQNRKFLPLAIGLSLLVFSAGLGAAMLGYYKFFPSTTLTPTPSPALIISNTPAATPVTEQTPRPIDQNINQNTNQNSEQVEVLTNATNQNVNQNKKQIEKQIVPNAPAPKPAPPEKINPEPVAPRPVPPPKPVPPVKNPPAGKQDKKDKKPKTPPVIIPY